MKEQQPDRAVMPVGTIEDWLEKRAKRIGAAQTNRYSVGSVGVSSGVSSLVPAPQSNKDPTKQISIKSFTRIFSNLIHHRI